MPYGRRLANRRLMLRGPRPYSKVVDLHIPTVASRDAVPEALQLALTHGATVYDSLYIIVALHARADLITADERLANATAARFPVKWLGAL
jgi:predicted nucleic acid-binding protein